MRSSKEQQHVGVTQVKRAITFEGDVIAERRAQESTRKPKKRGSYLPKSEQVEMLARSLRGDSIKKISEEMDRDWKAVARVVRSEEQQAEIERLRGLLIGLGEELLKSLFRCVSTEMDGQMAFQLGERVGFIPSLPQKNEITKMDSEQLIDAYRQRALMQLANVALERNRIYGSTPPMEREEFEKLVGKPPEGQPSLITEVVKKE